MDLKVVSWNIAGGHPMTPSGDSLSNDENLDYFIEELREIDADIICLQESHTPHGEGISNADEIAEKLGYKYVYNSPASPSHIDPRFQLSNAVISKIAFNETKTVTFPNPDVPLFFKNGKPAATHEKNFQIVDSGEFLIINNQLLPVSIFGYTYDDISHGGALAKEINKVMEEYIPSKPLLWCGDFNFRDPLSVFPFMQKLQLTDALTEENTTPTKADRISHPDHIFYSPEFVLRKSEIKHTNSDHYMCIAELSLSTSIDGS